MKIKATFNYYKTDNDNEYITHGGDRIMRFEKIDDKFVYYNSKSASKFEDDEWFNININQKRNKILNKNEDYFEIRFTEHSTFYSPECFLIRFYKRPYLYVKALTKALNHKI